MYQEHVLTHYGQPYHKGELPAGDGTVYHGGERSVVCGDEVNIQARIDGGVITEIWWHGDGCCFSQAATSMLVEHADGKTVEEMRGFREEDLLVLFQADCPISRRGCVFASLKALRKLLESHK